MQINRNKWKNRANDGQKYLFTFGDMGVMNLMEISGDQTCSKTGKRLHGNRTITRLFAIPE